MATMNPLEKKARSSFIKGLLVSGLIGVLVALALGYLLYKMKADEQARLKALVSVAVLQQDVKSGDYVTSAMFKDIQIDLSAKPAGALTKDNITNLSLVKDSEGNPKFNEKGEEITQHLVAKIDLPANSIVTANMIVAEEDKTTNDLREQEYNMIVLPTALQEGDTIDIRFKLPSGEDFIVLPKKRVKMSNLGESYSSQTIILDVKEEEMLTMSAVIVDAYQIAGSQLYANKYTEPGLQDAATATYLPSVSTMQLIEKDPNIVTAASQALIKRYMENSDIYRGKINNALGAIDPTMRQSAVESGVGTSTTTQQEERRTYLESMYGAE